jgi:histidine triad (HIT) family protein
VQDCIFCKIVRKEIPATVVYENDKVFGFDDIDPLAPVHVLIVPKLHISTLMDINEDNRHLLDAMFQAVREVAIIKGIDKSGFRAVINCNKEGGQIVFHLHLHVLGGRKLADGLG